jgi:hypothetical protein
VSTRRFLSCSLLILTVDITMLITGIAMFYKVHRNVCGASETNKELKGCTPVECTSFLNASFTILSASLASI